MPFDLSTLQFESRIFAADTAIERDLKLNFQKLTQESSLETNEKLFALYALAQACHHSALKTSVRELLQKSDEISNEQITEIEQSAGIMAMLNTYYRFRHFMKETHGGELDPSFNRAGLRMNSLSNPVIGKTNFEMLAFALSVINGCQDCVGSHAKTLAQHGVSNEKIHDLARLASVVKAISVLDETV